MWPYYNSSCIHVLLIKTLKLSLDFRNIIKLKTLGKVLNKEDLDENNFFFYL